MQASANDNLKEMHDDVIKWKHFPCNWPFVRGILRAPVNSLHKSQWRGALMFSLICALNKRFSKQSWGWWFVTPSRPLWRHCNEWIAVDLKKYAYGSHFGGFSRDWIPIDYTHIMDHSGYGLAPSNQIISSTVLSGVMWFIYPQQKKRNETMVILCEG